MPTDDRQQRELNEETKIMAYGESAENQAARYAEYWRIARWTLIGIVLLVVLIMAGCPPYGVWQQELSGKATLREAEWSRQVAIEEARALKESAVLQAEAEAIRAGGVAEANEIIGQSLRDNEAYLRYLWINGLHDGSSEIIYVPTEANLPILEATRLDRLPTP